MALAQYSEQFWYPDGSLATSVPARIFGLQSSTLATIYTDVTGAVLLPNPLNTSGSGTLTFWAEEGEYWIHIDSQAFRVQVGTPNNLDVFEVASAAVSTGTIAGGSMAAAGTSVAFGEIVGYVVNHSTDDFRPTITRVHKNAQSVPLDGPALARTLTWWLLDAAGNYVQQPLAPTNVQRRTHIVLGFSILFGGVVVFTKEVPQHLEQPYNNYADVTDSLGPFIIDGVQVSPNGVNLQFNNTSGNMFSRAFNHTAVPNNPNVAPIFAQAPTQFRRALSNTTVFPAPVTTIDPGNYESPLGTLTPIPGGTNVSSLHRLFCFAQASAPDQWVVQYGQRTYASLAAAVAAVGTEQYVVNPAFISSFVGWIAAIRTATDLSNPAQASFIPAPAKFSRP